MSRIITFQDKIPKIVRIFGLRQGFKDKSFPCQDFRETGLGNTPNSPNGRFFTRMGLKTKSQKKEDFGIQGQKFSFPGF